MASVSSHPQVQDACCGLRPVEKGKMQLIKCGQNATQLCAKCRAVFYCSVECQRAHWNAEHKSRCISRISDAAQALKKMRQETDPDDLDYFEKRLKAVFARWRDLRGETETFKEIPPSDQRELMSLMNFVHDMDLGVEPLVDQFASVPGIRVIRRSTDFANRPLPQDCAHFVFGKANWYKTDPMGARESLFGSYDAAIAFLQTKGYQPTAEPKVGDIVAYATSFFKPHVGMSHYAKIVQIDGPKIIVQSKWGPGHVFEHEFQFITFNYGSAYTFLTAGSSDAESAMRAKN